MAGGGGDMTNSVAPTRFTIVACLAIYIIGTCITQPFRAQSRMAEWLKLPVPGWHITLASADCVWRVESSKVQCFGGAGLASMMLGPDEEALDAILVNPKAVLVLSTTRLVTLRYRKGVISGREAVPLPSHKYLQIVGTCDGGTWLISLTSLDRVPGKGVVDQFKLADFKPRLAKQEGAREYSAIPTFAQDRIGNTIYFALAASPGHWHYAIYDRPTQQWLISKNFFRFPGPLLLVEGRIVRLDGTGEEVFFEERLTLSGGVNGKHYSSRNLFCDMGGGMYLVQARNKATRLEEILKYDSIANRIVARHPTDYGTLVSLWHDAQRIYYWSPSMSCDDIRTIVVAPEAR